MIGSTHIGITENVLNTLGKRWDKKSGETRWYVNDWEEAIGMEVTYYNTGNVSSVTWEGHGSCSNCWHRKHIAATKVWIDSDGAVHVDYNREEWVEKIIIDAIDSRIEEALLHASLSEMSESMESLKEGL